MQDEEKKPEDIAREVVAKELRKLESPTQEEAEIKEELIPDEAKTADESVEVEAEGENEGEDDAEGRRTDTDNPTVSNG